LHKDLSVITVNGPANVPNPLLTYEFQIPIKWQVPVPKEQLKKGEPEELDLNPFLQTVRHPKPTAEESIQAFKK
jgi:hypothetical protein